MKGNQASQACHSSLPQSTAIVLSIFGSEFGNSFPAAETHPIVPGFAQAVSRGEVLLIELVALEDLREHTFHREIIGVQNGVGGADRRSMMGIAGRNHWQTAKLRIFKGVSIVTAQRGGGVENFDRVDR